MNRRQIIWALVALAAMTAAPAILPGYYVGLLTKSLILGLFAMSLNLLLGQAGLATFGHALYFGIGAYVVAFLSLRWGITSFWLNTAAAVVAAGVLSALIAPLTLRARGTYYGMITLAVAQVGWGIAHGWRSFTNGDDGIPGLQRPVVARISFAGEMSFYYLVLVVCAICAALIAIVVASPFGHALIGTRENEIRMRVLGYSVWRYQFAASIVAGLFAGVAGMLFAYSSGYVSPVYLSVTMSAQTLLMVVMGGSTALFGPVLGALIIVLLDNLVSYVTERWLLVLGVVYVVVTLFAPRGVWPLLFRDRRRTDTPS
jgi:branched-chain amino acid transport system permease protein